MKHNIILLIFCSVLSQICGQESDSIINKTIYIQRQVFQSAKIIQGQKEIPYKNLGSILEDYELAYAEYETGKKYLRNSLFRLLKVFLYGFGTQILLEQMMEHNQDKYLTIVGIPLYGLIFLEYFKSFDDIRISQNHMEKAVWLYNNEVWKEAIYHKQK